MKPGKVISRIYNDLSLRRKLTIVFTAFISVLIIAIGTFTYQISVTNLEKSEKELLASNLELKGRMFNTYFMTIQRKVDQLFYNELIQNALKEDYTNFTISELLISLDNLYKITIPINEDISTIYNSNQLRVNSGIKIRIYPFNETIPIDGGLVHSFASIDGEAWIEQMIQNPNKVHWNSEIVGFDGIEYISVNRIMLDFSTFEQLGLISILIPKVNISESLRQTPNEKSEFIIQTDIGLFQNPASEFNISKEDLTELLIDEHLAGSGMQLGRVADKKMLHNSLELQESGWKLFLFYPYEEITRKMRSIQVTTIIFLLIGLVFSELLILIISKKLSQRLELITSKFLQVSENRYAPVTVIGGNDEIGRLDSEFNKMIRDLNLLIEKENHWEMEKNSLSLELMQAQINPHLLYNTLATIEWMAKKGETSQVQEITRKLIFFFKYYLNNGSLIAPVTEEMKMINEFIQIFIFTYQINCDVDFQVHTDLDDYYSIKLFLQPIVENALQHGIRPINSERRGDLRITADRDDQDLIFTISDNGLGMNAAQLESIENDVQASERGFGVRNVKKRIALYFGDQYGIHFSSQEGLGTTVTIRIPSLLKDEIVRIVE
jgi:two-component system, sensor histidine kinase YesM